MQPNVHVSSEIGALKRVIVHRPDVGISRISPKRAEELLFDDIVHLPRMQEEQDIFTTILKKFCGDNNVLEVEKLLLEAIIADAETKEEVIDLIIDYEELPKSYGDIMRGLSAEAAVEKEQSTARNRLEQVEDARLQLDGQLATLADTFGQVVRFGEIGLPLLGADGPKRYFVPILNPNEARGVGGFFRWVNPCDAQG